MLQEVIGLLGDSTFKLTGLANPSLVRHKAARVEVVL
jgi:hypothetical protein